MLSTLNCLIFELHNITQFAFDELNVFFCSQYFVVVYLFYLYYLN
jgi:hypothetical protein